MTITIYNRFLSKLFLDGDFSTLALKATLFESDYVPAKQHTTYTEITGLGTEVVGLGYSTGGKTLTGTAVSELAGSDAYVITADDVSWDPSTITARVAVLYEEATGDAVCAFVFDSDEISNNGLFEIQWNADGVLKIAQQV